MTADGLHMLPRLLMNTTYLLFRGCALVVSCDMRASRVVVSYWNFVTTSSDMSRQIIMQLDRLSLHKSAEYVLHFLQSNRPRGETLSALDDCQLKTETKTPK
jgi:hypothetical protein